MFFQSRSTKDFLYSRENTHVQKISFLTRKSEKVSKRKLIILTLAFNETIRPLPKLVSEKKVQQLNNHNITRNKNLWSYQIQFERNWQFYYDGICWFNNRYISLLKHLPRKSYCVKVIMYYRYLILK